MSFTEQDYRYLLGAGLAFAGDRPIISTINFAEVSNILKRGDADKTHPKTRDAIRGWLLAVRDHYPSLFALHFDEPRFHLLLSGNITGRDIKLRRLALSHISKVA